MMSADDIRKPCSSRKIQLPSRTKKDARIVALRKYDAIAVAFNEAMGRPLQEADENRAPRRSRACVFSLLNLLFLDEFSERFAESGDNLPREQLDGAVNGRDAFWNDIAAAFATEHPACGALLAEDEMFEGLELNTIVLHSGSKLRDMWKEVNSHFITVSASFCQSGTHEMEFKQFVQGRASTLYLWCCLKVKPGLTDFVNDGLFEEDEFDSLQTQLHPNRARVAGVRTDEASRKRRATSVKTPPKAKRQHAWGSQGSKEAFVTMAKSVDRYLSSRQEAQDRLLASGMLASTVDRAASFRLLDDLRFRIDAIQADLVSGNEVDDDRLREDLELCLRERAMIMDKLRNGPV